MLALGLPATVDAATTCASLACMQDLNALPGEDSNKCTVHNADGDACVKAYMTRKPDGKPDGTYSPCEYSPDDPEQYKPEDGFDKRCHSSRDV